MDKIKVRIANENDINALMELAEIWVHREERERRIMITISMTRPNYHIVVAEREGKLVAFMAFYIWKSWVNTEVRLDVATVFVHPDWRGKGLCKKLWNLVSSLWPFDIAFVDTNLEYPLHLGFEKSANVTYYHRKN